MKKCCLGDSQENAEIYKGKWAYYRLMLFLKNTTTPRSTDRNISDLDDTRQQNSDLSEIEETEYFGYSCMDNINLANNPEIEQHSSTHRSNTDSFVIPATIPLNNSSVSDAPQSSSIKQKKKRT